MATRDTTIAPGHAERERLLEGVPVTERHTVFAGIPTAVLEGGEGPPIVLLHGPNESAVNWRWVIPRLVDTHRVVAPDLPAHGSSGTGDGALDQDRVLAWLGELIEATCDEPPTLVGQILGGAIAARFAVDHGERLARLVLCDSLGLGRFRPGGAFAYRLLRVQARPTERNYNRFMDHCAYDLDGLKDDMGDDWEVFEAYNLALATAPQAKVGGRLLRSIGIPRIPPKDLAAITTPTTLIWGRHDEALKLKMAERVSARHGWPLHVIEDSADDPPRDQPEVFVEALRTALQTT